MTLSENVQKRMNGWIGKTADTLLRGWDKHTQADLREDLIQQGWVTALSAFQSFKEGEGSSLQSWIISQVKRDMVRYLRKEQSAGVNHEDIDDYMYEDDIDELIDYEGEERLEHQTMFHDLLGKLPERERNVVEMHYFDDMSYAEIGEILGITKQSVSDIFHKSVAKIQHDFT